MCHFALPVPTALFVLENTNHQRNPAQGHVASLGMLWNTATQCHVLGITAHQQGSQEPSFIGGRVQGDGWYESWPQTREASCREAPCMSERQVACLELAK